jgi:hypothetical protein
MNFGKMRTIMTGYIFTILFPVFSNTLLADTSVENPVPPKIASRTAIAHGETRFNKQKLSTYLGIHVAHEPALVMGAQFGLAPFLQTPFYVGPEVNFSFFSPGSFLGLLVGAWHEMRIYGAPRLGLSIGGYVGAVLTSEAEKYSRIATASYVDISIHQEVSDLALVRGQFRPGFVGGYFAFMMTLGITFRFA